MQHWLPAMRACLTRRPTCRPRPMPRTGLRVQTAVRAGFYDLPSEMGSSSSNDTLSRRGRR